MENDVLFVKWLLTCEECEETEVFRYYPPKPDDTSSSVLLQHQLAPANADILLDPENWHYLEDERHFKSIRLAWPDPNGQAVVVADDEDDDDDLTGDFERDPYWSDFWKPELRSTRFNSATNALTLALRKRDDAGVGGDLRAGSRLGYAMMIVFDDFVKGTTIETNVSTLVFKDDNE